MKDRSMIKFKDVKDQTTEEYFNGNEFSIDAFNKKYKAHENETYVQAVKRVCDYVASVEETKELRKYWSERWFDEIYNDWWHPAGSIMQGANSGRNISMMNCTTISLGTIAPDEEWDNLESIIRNAGYTVAKTAAQRQGLGLDFSRLRPVGTKVMNSANESSGVVHWMKFIDSIGYYVGQKGRIPAMLFSLSCDHPDIVDFITIKSDHTQIQNANISVQCTDAFYDAIKKDTNWEMTFEIKGVKQGDRIYLDGQSKNIDALYDEEKKKWYVVARRDRKGEKIKKTIKARDLLELIAKNMHQHAEPGIQNIDLARKYSNSDYVYDPEDEYDSRIISTNACCLVASSKVMTNKGWLTIEDVYKRYKNGDKSLLAFSYNLSSEQYELKPIINAWQKRNDSTVVLLIEENDKQYKIECSADHKILTRNRGYVEAASLTSDDDIMIFEREFAKLLSIKIKKEIKPLFDIEVKDNHNFVVNDGIVVKNSEQYLSRDALCVLSSINAGRFSANDEECQEELRIIGESVNRFLDNVNEAEVVHKTYATPHQKTAIEKLRRTGAGLTNICAWLFKKNLEYGTEEGNKAVSEFMKWYNYNLYASSIKLGEEKGSFELFNQEKYEQSPFIQRMMGLGLKFNTMRNVTNSSIAPTGTLTTQFRETALSYGIESAFNLYWWKRTRMGGKYEYYFCVPTVVREVFAQKGCPIPIEKDTIKDTWDGKIGKPIAEFIETNKSKIGLKFRCATEIDPMDKLDLMSQVMKWVDSSISVTYMLPENSDWKTVYDFILAAYEKEVKSIAAFPDKKMYGIVYLLFPSKN